MRKRLPVTLVATLAVALIIAEVLTGGAHRSPPRPAPALPRLVLVPPAVTVASLKGKPAVINFWASWCGPCRREAKDLARLPRLLGARARVVGVNWNDGAAGARAFVREYNWRFTNLRDASGAVGEAFGLSGLPTTYILDAQGRVTAHLTGPQTAADIARAVG